MRNQTGKMKYYRTMLETAGLINPQPRRSQSESSLKDLNQGGNLSPTGSSSTDNLTDITPQISPSGSLSQYIEYGHTDDVNTLKEQVS